MSTHVIPRPHESVDAALPLGRQPAAGSRAGRQEKVMVLARVKGTVVSTHKPDSMEGLRLLLLEKVDAVTLKGKGTTWWASTAWGPTRGRSCST